MPGFFRRVLVPLDTGPTTQQALPHLSHLLSGASGEAILSAVADDPFLADASRMYVEGIANRLHHLGLPVRTRVDVGPPVEKILEAARVEQADAILLSTPFRPGLGRLVFDESAEGIVRRSPVPVLVLRSGEAGAGRDHELKTILVPLDGSPESRQVLPLAEGLARSEGGRLVLLHVLRRVPESERHVPPEDRPERAMPRTKEWDQQVAERELTAAARDLAGRGLETRARVVTGEPVEAILATAEREGADLVVMTTHGRSGVSRLLAGSTTERVLRTSATPVLAVSLAGRESGARATPAA